MEGNAYFGVEYNAAGKLSKLYMPCSPTAPKNRENNIDEPLLISYKKQTCTLPLSAGHFDYLKALIGMQPNHATPFAIITEKDIDIGRLELIGSSPIGGDNENCIIS
jgi:hypothetical protein